MCLLCERFGVEYGSQFHASAAGEGSGGSGTPSSAAPLTVATFAPTGDAYVDGILSGLKWGAISFTFSFPGSASYYGSGYGSGEPSDHFEAFNATQKDAVRAILTMYSAVANVTFSEVTETSSVHGDFRYAESDMPPTAWAYFPTTNAAGGDSWFNNSTGWYDNPVLGNYAWVSMIHETGHAFGLKHPHDTFGDFEAMPPDRDSLEYTVMSYKSYIGSNNGGYTNGSTSYPQTLMMYDIAALQLMHGANYSTNAGNTVYAWDPLTGQESIDGVVQAAPAGNKVFMTLWDGGGTDTYDFSSYTVGLQIDLRPGAWTALSATQRATLGSGHLAAGSIANALLYNDNPASLIENANGGSASDTIVGNAADNRLKGGGGNDSIDGIAGVNTAVYSGATADYSVVDLGGTWRVTDIRAGSPDGVDTLANIQFLQFSDGVAALGADPPDPPDPPDNTAPVAANDVYYRTGQTITVPAADGVLANDSDANGDTLTAILVRAPSPGAGTVQLNQDGSFSFVAKKGYNGTASFDYTVADGTDQSNVATVIVYFGNPPGDSPDPPNPPDPPDPPDNSPPVAVEDVYYRAGRTIVVPMADGVLGNDSDSDGDALSAILVRAPSRGAGTLQLNQDGSFAFTAKNGYDGTASFDYKVTDGTDESNVVTVVIRYGDPPGDPPDPPDPSANTPPVVANDVYYRTDRVINIPVADGVLANDSDADGDALSAVLVRAPSPGAGTVQLSQDGSFSFVAKKGYSGTASFDYKVTDGTDESDVATVVIYFGTAANPPGHGAHAARASARDHASPHAFAEMFEWADDRADHDHATRHSLDDLVGLTGLNDHLHFSDYAMG